MDNGGIRNSENYPFSIINYPLISLRLAVFGGFEAALAHPVGEGVDQGTAVLRAFLPEASFAGERDLCNRMFHDCGVNISPGNAFHCAEPGWFRLCFTVPEAHQREGLRRLVEGLALTSRA